MIEDIRELDFVLVARHISDVRCAHHVIHRQQRVTGISCRVRSRKIELEVSARGDCEPELDTARKKANLFERTFDRTVNLRAVPAGREDVLQKDLEILSAEALWN